MGQDNFDIKNDGSLFLINTEINADVKSAKSIYLQGVIIGNIHCESKVMVDKCAIVRGDIYCRELVMNGLVSGNVKASFRAELGDFAVIKGYLITPCVKICTNSVVENGLRLESYRVQK